MKHERIKARPKRRQRVSAPAGGYSLEEVNRLEVAGEWIAPSALAANAASFAAHAGRLNNELRASIFAGETGTLDLAWEVNSHIVAAWRLVEMLQQSMIVETNGLWSLPPIWEIDQQLNAKRESLLALWFPRGDFVAGGDFISFEGPVVRVASNDAWHFDTGTRNDFGSGLVSLAARLHDRPIHQIASQLAAMVGIQRSRP